MCVGVCVCVCVWVCVCVYVCVCVLHLCRDTYSKEKAQTRRNAASFGDVVRRCVWLLWISSC